MSNKYLFCRYKNTINVLIMRFDYFHALLVINKMLFVYMPRIHQIWSNCFDYHQHSVMKRIITLFFIQECEIFKKKSLANILQKVAILFNLAAFSLVGSYSSSLHSVDVSTPKNLQRLWMNNWTQFVKGNRKWCLYFIYIKLVCL